jgi:hypothetical protein
LALRRGFSAFGAAAASAFVFFGAAAGLAFSRSVGFFFESFF